MAFADNEKIRYVDRILSIGLRIASEQKPGTVTRPNYQMIAFGHCHSMILKKKYALGKSLSTLFVSVFSFASQLKQ